MVVTKSPLDYSVGVSHLILVRVVDVDRLLVDLDGDINMLLIWSHNWTVVKEDMNPDSKPQRPRMKDRNEI